MSLLCQSVMIIPLCLNSLLYIQQWWKRFLFWFLSHHSCQSDVSQRDPEHGRLSEHLVSFLTCKILSFIEQQIWKGRKGNICIHIFAYFKPFKAHFSLLTIYYLLLFEASNWLKLQWDFFFSVTLHFPPSYLIHAHYEHPPHHRLSKAHPLSRPPFFFLSSFCKNPAGDFFFFECHQDKKTKTDCWSSFFFFNLMRTWTMPHITKKVGSGELKEELNFTFFLLLLTH